MNSLIRMLVAAAVTASVFGVTEPRSALADAVTQHGSTSVETLGLASSLKPAAQTFRGVVASVDESKDMIEIQRSRDATEDLRVQDGLLFNAVRYGDLVEVTVEDINGTKTFVGLKKE